MGCINQLKNADNMIGSIPLLQAGQTLYAHGTKSGVRYENPMQKGLPACLKFMYRELVS